MEKREKTINGRSYQMLLPAVRQSMPLCPRFTALVGPTFGVLGLNADRGGWEVFASVLQGLDPTKADALLMDAVRISNLCFNGQQISDDLNFERHFSQYRGDVYPVCVWALWECVRDFFPQWADFLQKIKSVVASLSPTDGPTTTG